MKPIITVESLGKIYRIGTLQSYYTLRDNILDTLSLKKKTKTFIKALDNISFEVYPGEKIGIIGKNGAGKTTLLKILSRITPPTEGSAILRGKVASLLEVGTGFHGELTGRENIFFNGAILGMKRDEIKRKLDEIVAFAGIEKFLDTPVKHYSSGMQMRLGFAIAAHLEAEILLFDEILAVGDAEFQDKALNRMQSVSNQKGRTILFVSHNMTAILTLCEKVIYLENGNISFFGKTTDGVNLYISKISETNHYYEINEYDVYKYLKILNISVKSEFNNIITLSDVIEIIIDLLVYEIPSEKFHVTLKLKDFLNNEIFTATHWFKNIKLNIGYNKLTCYLPSKFLNVGYYCIDVYVFNVNECILQIKDKVRFRIHDSKKDSLGWLYNEGGILYPPDLTWKIEYK
ncbi:MAG: ABC transporter ATP-binding protein [Bacteroidales bacterium]|nr:ABC transporter ATP-binding protein [Bacteroidales bacterium]